MIEINKIYCCNCLDLFPQIENESVDLIITSPPYSQIRTYQGFSFDFENIAIELTRLLKIGGVICWIINDQYIKGSRDLISFKQAIFFKEECGLNVHDIMVYQKHNFSHPSSNRYHQTWEQMQIYSKGKPKTFNPIQDRKNITAGCIGSLGTNTFTNKDGSKSIRKRKINKEYGMRHNVWLGKTSGQENFCRSLPHPAIMPRWIAEDHIKSWSNEGDLILDPMMGSGTVCLAAKKLNRNFIGMDISNEYCEIGKKRLKILEK